jgi:hypothetical protein
MKGIYTAIVATLELQLAKKCNAVFDTFIGPGVVECNQGECEFSVKAGRGCIDPCHTRTHYHMYDMSFIDVADVSVDPSNDNIIDEPCFFKYAKHIDAHYPDQYVDIEEGCTAKCSGCIFAPTDIFRKTFDALTHLCIFCFLNPSFPHEHRRSNRDRLPKRQMHQLYNP